MKSTTNFLTGFLLGSVVAAGVVLLFTPGSGEDNRTGIKDWAMRVREEVLGASEQKRIELEQQLEMLREPRQPEPE
jgi:gas vesicle protein